MCVPPRRPRLSWPLGPRPIGSSGPPAPRRSGAIIRTPKFISTIRATLRSRLTIAKLQPLFATSSIARSNRSERCVGKFEPIKPSSFDKPSLENTLMRAIVIQQYGGPEQLVVQELPDPEPMAGHVVIEVKAFGLNHADTHMRKGECPEAPKVSGIERVGLAKHCP